MNVHATSRTLAVIVMVAVAAVVVVGLARADNGLRVNAAGGPHCIALTDQRADMLGKHRIPRVMVGRADGVSGGIEVQLVQPGTIRAVGQGTRCKQWEERVVGVVAKPATAPAGSAVVCWDATFGSLLVCPASSQVGPPGPAGPPGPMGPAGPAGVSSGATTSIPSIRCDITNTPLHNKEVTHRTVCTVNGVVFLDDSIVVETN